MNGTIKETKERELENLKKFMQETVETNEKIIRDREKEQNLVLGA